jgi:peptidoglycan/xylan/chitin deacetylase (PgdA/CDA1 family)
MRTGTEPGEPLALRMDDVGASTKRYEIYSNKRWRVGPLEISGNWLFLKYLPGIRAWGPYRELRPGEFESIFAVLKKYDAVITIGVTAAWVNRDSSLTPFPEKYPAQAAVLREGIQAGLVEIANHGLTHCVLGGYAFRPAWRHSNRKAHREFWPHVPVATHEEHIRQAQDILQDTFGVEVITFVPPGNVFTQDTLEIAARYGLRIVSCEAPPQEHPQISFIGNENVLAFHDREIVLEGTAWLEGQLAANRERKFCFVRDLAQKRVPT